VSPAAPVATLPSLVAGSVIDASTAALAWLMLERGVPALIAGPDRAVASSLLDALVEALPPVRRPDPVRGAGGDRLVRVAGCLEITTPPGILRAALAATSGRSGLALAIAAEDLAGVLAVLRGQGLSDDEISFMGVVLVVDRCAEAGGEPRVTSAHYLRPLVRDAGGHPRRQRPAVLATWVPGDDRWEDFAWGIGPDLAERCGMRGGDFEAERERRAALLAGHPLSGHALSGDALAGHAHHRPVG
jgi:hypothetical protein